MKYAFQSMAFGLTLFVVFAAVSLSLSGCKDKSLDSSAPAVSTKNSADSKGGEIVAEYLKRDSAPFRKTRVRLVVEPIEGKKEVFVLETLRKQTGSETRSFTKIVEPKEDNDVATLTIEKKGEPTVNINYIASRKQFRESGTNKIFFGGLTSQELLGEWDKYNSKLLSEKNVDGVKLFEVESNLKPTRKSVITRIVTYFGADDYLPRELHLYNSTGEEIRTFEILETRSIEDRKFVSKTRIQNHVYKATVIIDVLEMTYPENIPAIIFERENLKP